MVDAISLVNGRLAVKKLSLSRYSTAWQLLRSHGQLARVFDRQRVRAHSETHKETVDSVASTMPLSPQAASVEPGLCVLFMHPLLCRPVLQASRWCH